MYTPFMLSDNNFDSIYTYNFSESLNTLKNGEVRYNQLNPKSDNSANTIINLYLCLMCADVPEDMAFPSIKGAYKKIEDIVKNLEDKSHFLCLDPMISVYSGNYDFAKELIRTADNFLVESLIESEEWEFVDFITDKGKNQKHFEILTDLLTRDYIEGGNNLLYYCGRYGSHEFETYDECLERAVREVNDVDLIFEKIKSTVLEIRLKSPFPEQLVNKQETNERVIDVLKKCAKLGYQLKTFNGFGEMFLPEFEYVEKGDYDDIYDRGNFYCIKEIILPLCIADLIGENTVVSLVNENTCSFMAKDKNGIRCMDQFEYIGRHFLEKNGHKLIVEVKTPDCLCGINFDCRYFLEFKLTKEFMQNVYLETKKLKAVLKKGYLSQKNIEEISGYFAEKICNCMNSEAINKLDRLNKLLSGIGGVRNE